MKWDPEAIFQDIKKKAVDKLSSSFPMESGGRIIEADKIWVDDNKDIGDLRGQKQARMSGSSWSVPVKGDLVLRDERTNRVIDRKTIKLMDLPKTTPRLGMIYNGNEYQASNLLLLRPGIYTRKKADGSLASEFHTKGRAFDIKFDPDTRKFSIRIGNTNPDLYPVLKAIGVNDLALEKTWGKEILEANKGGNPKSMEKMYKAFTGKNPESSDAATHYVLNRLLSTELDPVVTSVTSSKPFKTVTPEAMVDASSQLLALSRGTRKSDARDSLMFKKFRAVDDHIADKVEKTTIDVKRKIGNNIRRSDDLRRVMPPKPFQPAIDNLFTQSGLLEAPGQVNPVDILSAHTQATVLGEGGIRSEHQATGEMRLVDPSHLGFMDPIHTPEGGRVGLTLHLAEGVRQRGDMLEIPVWDIKNSRMVHRTVQELHGKKIVLPDQVDLGPKGVVPKKKSVRIYNVSDGVQGEKIPFSKADYSMLAPQQGFSAAANMLPFMQNNSPLRATVASRQLQQALPLVNRESPLIQVGHLGISGEQRWGRYHAHTSPINGEVVSVKNDAVVVKDKQGENHEVQVYRNFPMNDRHAFLDSDIKVSKGDKVKKGDILADSNFTKDGVLSLGTNLKTAFSTFRGLNFEDAVVISDEAAKKLTSSEMRKKQVKLGDEDVVDLKAFGSYYGKSYSGEQLSKLGDDGVVRVGELVKPGDPLIAALRKAKPTHESGMLRRLHKSLVKPYDNAAVIWDSEQPGIVTDAHKTGDRVSVHVRSDRPAEVGDKLTSRSSNKGVISTILPSAEMPRTTDGKPVEVIINPSSLPSRMVLGQVYETALAKLADKDGKPRVVTNFDGGVDALSDVKKEMKAAGVSDKEPLFDPKTGKKLGDVLVGPHYILKLKHEVERTRAARAGGPGYSYDRDRVPKGGGPTGAKALGNLGLYSMLSRGVKANIREGQTWLVDADQNDEVWTAIQRGLTPPAPRPTFAFNKFTGYLKAMGLDVKKEGNTLTLAPMTDKQIVRETAGEIRDPGRVVRAIDPSKPEKGGLFDEAVTGGLEGKKWSRYRLSEPTPNPLFEVGIKRILDLKQVDFDDIVEGKRGVARDGSQVPIEKAVYTGGRAIKKMLDGVDVNKEIRNLESSIPGLSQSALSSAYKKLRYLRAIKENGMTPSEAYITNYIPVLPPAFRPLRTDEDGNIVGDDINSMYRDIGNVSKKLGEIGPMLPDDDKTKQRLRKDLYDGMKALTGVGTYPLKPWRGIMDIIEGKKPDPESGGKKGSPKEGFFQKKLLGARQDLTMYSTITPDPTLGLDEVGIPRKLAMETYKPFVIRDIHAVTGLSPLKAQQLIKDDDVIAHQSLDRVVRDRPISLKRDPALHRYSVSSYKPRLVSGNVIKLHPLSTGAYNADFDGDRMSAFVPIGSDAVKEAFESMPSNNLFNPATGKLMYLPSQEMQTGLYLLSREGKRRNLKFDSLAQAREAVEKGKLDPTDVVSIGGVKTTTGRMEIADTMPEDLGKRFLKEKSGFGKNQQKQYLEDVARDHKDSYGDVANRLKDLGNRHVYDTGFSLGLDDFTTEKKIRDAVLTRADVMARGASDEDRIRLYDKATQAMMTAVAKKKAISPDNLWLMQSAGVKPGPDQYRQLVLAPMLMRRPDGSVIPDPVKRSFPEGLSLGDYWTAVSGGRRGIIQKVESVREPGFLTKETMNSVMDEVVISDDCGTDKGIRLPVDDDCAACDRVLAKDTKVGRTTLPAGTVIDQQALDKFIANKVSHVTVRSPLRCSHGVGMCSKCYGKLPDTGDYPDIGQNIGVMSAQTLGERGTQLALKAFHGGGVVPAGKLEGNNLVDQFSRVSQILHMPKTIPGSAPLVKIEKKEGVVESVSTDPSGGHEVMISGVRHYVPYERGVPTSVYKGRRKPVRPGATVRRGDPLSAGPINPHELLPLAGLGRTQRYLSDELYDLYRDEGVDRRTVETVVRGLTNTGKVDEPGDVPGFTRGDTISITAANKLNSDLPQGGRELKYAVNLKGVNLMPLEKTEDWLARMNHNRLKSTVIEAAQQGWKSSIHGVNPIPAAVYGAEFGIGKFY